VVKRIVLVVGMLLIAAAPVLAAPAIKPVTQRKFDHARHITAAQTAKQANRRTAACADCHQMDNQGTRQPGKEHAIRCVKCHKDPLTCNAVKVPGPASPARRCIICHVPTPGSKCTPNDMPPLPQTDSFQAGFAHGKHIQFGAAIERECATCHVDQALPPTTTPPPAHNLCASCHDGQRSKLGMTNCDGCHKQPQAKAGPSGDPYRIANFNHRQHHMTANEAACTKCHTKEAIVSGQTVPRPGMLGCQQACHDGVKAFSAVGTSCTRCHTSGNTAPIPANKMDQIFTHAAHANRNVKITGSCETCHALKDDGNVDPVGTNKNHQPCAASGCHQTEFLSKQNKICGVCHEKSAPWQKTVARMVPPEKPEWFANMNHQTHLVKKGNTNSACGDCHGDKLGGGRPPRGHDACSQCHGRGAPAHPMNACGGCHVQGEKADRAPTSEWSVKDTFLHEKHTTDPKTRKPTQCVNCHADVKSATTMATIKKPTMQSCDACHDGKSVFKTTGYECSRCHTRKKEPSTTSMLKGDIGDGVALVTRGGNTTSGVR
jgi:hypothetical protein